MKDYFDLWVLLTEETLDPAELHRAVQATFTRRRMVIPDAIPAGLSGAFAQDATKQKQWAAFLKKNRLQPLDLFQIVGLMRNEFQRFQAL